LPTVRAACHTFLRVPLAVQSAACQLIRPVRVSLRCQCPAELFLGHISLENQGSEARRALIAAMASPTAGQ
jgi:hypothetical protein